MLALFPLLHSVMRGLISGKAGVDFIALLAMVGALLLHEYLAGAVIALMLAGGRGLEEFAAARARRELSALIELTPRTVHRREGDAIVPAGIEVVRPGDLLLIKPGEVVRLTGL
jgi:cation transport ATPase